MSEDIPVDYSTLTMDQFHDLLMELLENKSGYDIANIPGVYELVSEYYNNDVLDLWEQRNA